MSKRVIYNGFNGPRSHIVKFLEKEHGWIPVYFHETQESKAWVEASYPNAVFGDIFSLRQGDFDYSNIGEKIPIDEKIINALIKFESNYLSWLEDTTGWNFSFHERRSYYYEILKYWNSVIHHLKPDIFLSYTTPHTPSEYALYLLCKHYYQIPVVYLNPIPFFNDDYFIFSVSNEDTAAICKELYLSDEELEISQPVKEYLEKLRSPEAEMAPYIQRKLSDMAHLDKQWYLDYWAIFKLIILGKAFKKSNMSFKKNKKPWSLNESKLSNAEYYLFKRDLARRNDRIKQIYKKMCEEPDLDQPFIYFPAPYQPEVLSNLSAGIYEDVFLILDMLSNLIPENWTIYYKEHPNTFMKEEKGPIWRSEDYYHRIKKYKNLKFVSHSYNTFDLTKKCQAVCTVGGSAGWEAAVKGKPALVFGALWYQNCKSIFMIRTMEDMSSAMKKIQDGFVPDFKDIARYAESIYRHSNYKIITNRYFKERIAECHDPEKEMERVAKGFYETYQKYYEQFGKDGRERRKNKEEVCEYS